MDGDVKSGYKIIFSFAANQYFENAEVKGFVSGLIGKTERVLEAKSLFVSHIPSPF